MIQRIARKEFLEMTRDGRARVAAGIVLALLMAALLMGFKRQAELSQEVDAARRSVRQQWLTQTPKNPHTAAHYGTYAFKPRSPLSMVDNGIDRYTGVALFLEPHRQNDFRFRPAQDATLLERFGQMTAAVTLQILLPLVIVMLAFPAFAGERELGTLRQLLSAGVQPADLAWGKLIGVAASLALLLVPATVLGVAVLSWTSLAQGDLDSLWRAGWLVLAFLLYFGAWGALSVAVSARSRSSRVALVTLLAFWIANCLVAPRAMSDLAARLHPTGSAMERYAHVAAESRRAPDGHNPDDPFWKARKEELLAQYKVKTVAELPFNFDGYAMVEAERHSTELYDEYFRGLWSQYAAQDRVYRWGGLAAPMLSIQSLSMAMAGTDFAHQQHLAQAAEAYRLQMTQSMNGNIRDTARYGDRGYKAGQKLWQSVPDFVYQMPGAGWAISRQLLPLGILAVWCLGAGWFAVASARKVHALA